MTTPAHDDFELDAGHQLLCVVDAQGRLSEIGAGADMLGWGPSQRWTPVQDAVHPADAPRLMVALSLSAADRRAAILDLRMRRPGGEWIRVRCQVSPLAGHEPPRYALALRLSPTEGEAAAERAALLEGHLWRIALEVQAAGIGLRSSIHEAWWSAPEVVDLSERQADILRRVVQGQRVGDIAQELGIAQSTVRNHLSVVYDKFGVHSQSALISRLMSRDL